MIEEGGEFSWVFVKDIADNPHGNQRGSKVVTII